MRLILSLALLLFLVSGCSDDESPNRDVDSPALESLWPNEDGRYWAFAGENRWDHGFEWPHYPTKAEVPPLGLTISQLYTAMLTGEMGPAEESGTASWAIAFDGTVTDGSGQECQQVTQAGWDGSILFYNSDGWMMTDERITLHASDYPEGTVRVLVEAPLGSHSGFQWLPMADESLFDHCIASTRILGNFQAGDQSYESCVAILYLMSERVMSSGTNDPPDYKPWSRYTRISVLILAAEVGPVYLRDVQTAGDFVDGKIVGTFHDTELWLVDHGFLD